MTRRFRQMKVEERDVLAAMRRQGMSLRAIGSALGRCASTIDCSATQAVALTFLDRLNRVVKRVVRGRAVFANLIQMNPCGLWCRICWVGCGRHIKLRRHCVLCGPTILNRMSRTSRSTPPSVRSRSSGARFNRRPAQQSVAPNAELAQPCTILQKSRPRDI